jgi:hypothetical protein
MRLLFAFLIAVTSCNNSNANVPKDMNGGGGLICPNHPENCQGTCCGEKCLNTSVDVNNCGGCNAACSGGTICMGGKCGCLPSGAPCAMAQTCCPNAGCANLMNDLRNCGKCGNVCMNGETCVNGACACGGMTCTGTNVCCNGTCQATCNVPVPDMASSSSGDGGSGLPLCDCTGLIKILGNQCPLTSQCVGHNCCLEDTLGLGNVMCTTDPTCQTSVTPQ